MRTITSNTDRPPPNGRLPASGSSRLPITRARTDLPRIIRPPSIVYAGLRSLCACRRPPRAVSRRRPRTGGTPRIIEGGSLVGRGSAVTGITEGSPVGDWSLDARGSLVASSLETSDRNAVSGLEPVELQTHNMNTSSVYRKYAGHEV